MATEITTFGRNVLDAQSEAVPCFPGYPRTFPGEENDPITENCLTMDIYIPNDDDNTERGILFWIHGGGYSSGDSKFYSGIEQGLVILDA